MPSYLSWGFTDVGVFIDWCSLYQDTPAYPRTPSQLQHFRRAKNQMSVYYAHRLTVVYLIPQLDEPAAAAAAPTEEEGAETTAAAKVDVLPPSLTPPAGLGRNRRGWPMFEEAACRLFKQLAPNRPFKMPSGTFQVRGSYTCTYAYARTHAHAYMHASRRCRVAPSR